MVTSLDQLCGVLYDWHHLDSHKLKLFRLCEEMLKGLDDLRQGLDEEDEEETQPVDQVEKLKKLKIKVPPLKPRAYEGDPIDLRPQKRQCR